jgi:hypothetical protein
VNFIEKFIVTKVLKWVAGKLDGYKTKIGGVGLVLYGILGFLGGMFPKEGLPTMDPNEAMGYIAGGMGVLGIGGKLEKQKKATEAHAEAVKEQTKTLKKLPKTFQPEVSKK